MSYHTSWAAHAGVGLRTQTGSQTMQGSQAPALESGWSAILETLGPVCPHLSRAVHSLLPTRPHPRSRLGKGSWCGLPLGASQRTWCGVVQQPLVVRSQHQWYLAGFCRVVSAVFLVAPGPSPPAALVLGPEPQ